MRILPKSLLSSVLLVAAAMVVAAEEDGSARQPAADAGPSSEDAAAEPLPEEYSCKFCHGKDGTLAETDDTKHLIITEEHLIGDIHWKKGLRCHDCHGGNPKLEDYVDHRDDEGFYSLASPHSIPGFCGRCHSDIEYMRRYRPSPRTDQEAEYWTSGHGVWLKQWHEETKEESEEEAGDPGVATCVSCHGHHDIRTVDDLESPVYPTRLAKTCATCHGDADRMADRQYQGRPLGHDQYENWSKSVHAEALLKNGDMSAPTCNDCHGNHGAVPPEVDSVANACGTCHVKVAALFAETRMKHRFEQVDLPGCVACHGNHEIRSPTDEMLGMEAGGVCAKCHGEGEGKFGATLAGAEVARQMRAGLEKLKRQIGSAEEELDEAEVLGMLVRVPRFELRQARDALTNARSLVHSFEIAPMKKAIDEGLRIGADVEQKAQQKLEEYTFRRVWLALSLVPILLVVGLLLLYIRSLPLPER